MARQHTIFAAQDGWTVIDSFEYVPEGRYEVRDPQGRQHGIWESVETAREHMLAKIAADPELPESIEDWFTD